jgi:hypothetical protein
MRGDAVLLRDEKLDPVFPPPGPGALQEHVGQGEHEILGIFARMSSVGMFSEARAPYYRSFTALYPGRYRVRASFWSLQWDRGQILPSRGTEAARLNVVHLQEQGRHEGHPSDLLGYFDAPSLKPQVHELDVWLNFKDCFGFNPATLVPVDLYRDGTWGQKGGTMGYTGPCTVNDWLEVEGPLHEVWPPRSHRLLFGELPITEFKVAEQKGIRPPVRTPLKHFIGRNQPDPEPGLWTVASKEPHADADRLLADFLPKAFRRPVEEAVRKEYVAQVEDRLRAGDAFETAMRWAYRAALCSPDFLYHFEPAGRLDDSAIAARLSYFFWNSGPDDMLTALAAGGNLSDADVLSEQVERLLKDAKAQRFIDDFLGQWLKLRSIAANDPDKKLYPEFNPYLQDSMVAETCAYFRELIEQNLSARHLVQSDFAMLNEKLAVHYDIPGVSGTKIRRVKLPDGCVRGGFLTQAAVLKVTANGTTTSPVVRGAFVMARLLGKPPEQNHPRRMSPPWSPTYRAPPPSASSSTNIAPMPTELPAMRRWTRPASRWRPSMSSAVSATATAASARATPRHATASTRASASASNLARRWMRAASCPMGARSPASLISNLSSPPTSVRCCTISRSSSLSTPRAVTSLSATAPRLMTSSRAPSSKVAASARCCTKLSQADFSRHADETPHAPALPALHQPSR